MKKLFAILCALFALSTASFAQRVRVDVDMGESVTSAGYQYRIGDIVQVGGELGVVFSVTTDGKHGKILSLVGTDCDWWAAKRWCSQLGNGWKLPTIHELYAICNKLNIINSTIVANGYPTMADWYHWSCEESDSEYAWGVRMSDGDTDDYYKGSSSYVRAVSAF